MEEEKFSLENKLAEIRGIVDQMQKGVSDFDQQVALFEKGSRYTKDCQEYLDKAELKIKQLIDGKLKDVKLDI